LSFIDDHSRFLLSVDCHSHMRTSKVIELFKTASIVHGYPFCVHSDNGTQFTTRYVKGLSELEKVLMSLGIKTKHGRPYKPTTQGKVERYHQTLKKFLNKNGPYKSVRGLQKDLDKFKDYYNNVRPHSSADNKPPVVKYLKSVKAKPEETSYLNDYQLQNNRVGQAGKVTMRYNQKVMHLGIGRKHRNKKVTIKRIGRKTTVIETSTAEILAQHTINVNKNYQPNKLKK